MKKKMYIRLPTPLWNQLRPEAQEVAIRLKNGNILDGLVVSEKGDIWGKLVGGHDGVEELSVRFESDDIIAVRSKAGLLGQSGFRRWIEL